jgi:hypothetical protein
MLLNLRSGGGIISRMRRVPVRVGRPPVSRLGALEEVKAMKHTGRNRVLVRHDRLARNLECSVRTAGRILADLERDEYIQRVKRRGHDGVLVEHQGAHPSIRPSRVLGTVGPVNAR